VPDERHRRPGRDLEVEVVEDVRKLAVAEANVLEADVPVDPGERTRVRRVDDVRFLVEDDGDAVERGRRGEVSVV
jgi:hypothetical protein